MWPVKPGGAVAVPERLALAGGSGCGVVLRCGGCAPRLPRLGAGWPGPLSPLQDVGRATGAEPGRHSRSPLAQPTAVSTLALASLARPHPTPTGGGRRRLTQPIYGSRPKFRNSENQGVRCRLRRQHQVVNFDEFSVECEANHYRQRRPDHRKPAQPDVAPPKAVRTGQPYDEQSFRQKSFFLPSWGSRPYSKQNGMLTFLVATSQISRQQYATPEPGFSRVNP